MKYISILVMIVSCYVTFTDFSIIHLAFFSASIWMIDAWFFESKVLKWSLLMLFSIYTYFILGVRKITIEKTESGENITMYDKHGNII